MMDMKIENPATETDTALVIDYTLHPNKTLEWYRILSKDGIAVHEDHSSLLADELGLKWSAVERAAQHDSGCGEVGW